MMNIGENEHGHPLRKFSYTFTTIIMWSTCEQLLTWICYCASNQKWVLKMSYFGFLFWFTSAILLSKMKSLFYQPLHQFSMGHCATSTGYPSREVCTNLQFSLVKLWNIIWTYGGFNLQITTSKSTHIVFILFEIAWVEIYF